MDDGGQGASTLDEWFIQVREPREPPPNSRDPNITRPRRFRWQTPNLADEDAPRQGTILARGIRAGAYSPARPARRRPNRRAGGLSHMSPRSLRTIRACRWRAAVSRLSPRGTPGAIFGFAASRAASASRSLAALAASR